MGQKLWFTGAAITLGLDRLFSGLNLGLVGAILLLIGTVLIWLDK